MRSTALLAALLTTLPLAAAENAAPIGDEIFACNFDNQPPGAGAAARTTDRDYDGWPDGWTRERSLKLPEFVQIAIVGEGQTIASAAAQSAPAETNRVLRIELDGGGAALSSPAAPISPQFSLLLSLRMRATGLKHDRAWAMLSLLDAEGRELQTLASPPVAATGEWQRVEIGPITPESAKAARAVVSKGHTVRSPLYARPRSDGSEVR